MMWPTSMMLFLIIYIIISKPNDVAAFTTHWAPPSFQRHNSQFATSIAKNQETILFKSSSNIEISQLQSNADVISLADLRYKEWILGDSPFASPSQASFRLATSDICQERKSEGAVVFLAKLRDNNDDSNSLTLVGAAELSPIELRGCVHKDNSQVLEPGTIAMYATDVVTSTSHRRLGIGSKLMTLLEDTAYNLGCRFVLLHVEHENIAAINFYRRLGYVHVAVSTSTADDVEEVLTLSLTSKGLSGLHVSTVASKSDDSSLREINNPSITVKTRQLAINAGTVGQLLLVKAIKNSKAKGENKSSRATSASGFSRTAVGFSSSKLKKGSNKQ